MPAIRSSCATRAIARRRGRNSMPRWTGCWNACRRPNRRDSSSDGRCHLRRLPGCPALLPSLPHRRARLAVLRQFVEHGFEILGLAEIAIDRGEAHIGDVVERTQRLHYHLAHGLGGDFALALALELAHDLGHGLVDTLGLDRTLAQRDLHRAQQLVAIERHAAAVALDDHQLTQLHALECGKAEIAGQAHAAAADDGGILGRPRVLDLGIEAAAIRTAHGRPLLCRRHCAARLKAARRQSATSVVAMFGRPVGTDCGARAHARDGNDERVAVGSHGASALIDGKSTDEFPYFLAYRGFGERILFDALLREDIEDLDDQLAHLLELGDAEAAGSAGGGAEAYS